MSGQPHGEWNAQTFQEGKFFTSRIGLAVRSARQRPRAARVVLVWRRSHPREVATGARDQSTCSQCDAGRSIKVQARPWLVFET